MAEWIDACAAGDIEGEDVIRFDHGTRNLIIVRDHEDNYYCTDGLCTHEEIHLADGLVVETTIECSKHALVFDVSTGEMNWPIIERALRDMGYDGPIGMEAYAGDDPGVALDAFRKAFTV